MLFPLALLALQVLPLPGARARVELLSGRAALAGPGGVEALAPAGPARELEGPAYLELAALGRAALRWNGLGSAELRGPAALEWRAGEGLPLELRLLSFRDLHLEVRRGPAWLELPGGWRASVENGACYLAQLPSGQVELQHDAGRPLLLFRPGDGGRARPPLTVLPGARLRLDPCAPRPLELVQAGRLLDPFGRPDAAVRPTPAPPPWRGFAWPWAPPVNSPTARLPAAGSRPGPTVEDAPLVASAAASDPEPFRRLDLPGGAGLRGRGAAPGPALGAPALVLPGASSAAPRPVAAQPAPVAALPAAPPAADLPSLGSWKVRREGRLELGPWGADWVRQDPLAGGEPPAQLPR